jgi:PAS domain S-box-containing protein
MHFRKIASADAQQMTSLKNHPDYDSAPSLPENDGKRPLEAGFDGIWAIDAQLRTSFVNRRMAKMLGYSSEEMVGRNFLEFIFPEDVPAEREAIARRHGISEEFEIRYRRKDGSELWARVSSAPIFGKQGEFEGAVGVHSDVTDRRRAEQALRKREAELNEAERIAQLGSWQWAPETDTVLWSEGMYRIIGRAAGLPPVSYRELSRFCTPESGLRLSSAMEAALATGAAYKLDLELIREGGVTRWVVARGEATRGADGRILQLHGTFHDITERKIVEEAKLRLAAIVESSDDPIISKDLNGTITSWNAAATRMFGYSAEEAIGKSILMLIPPELQQEENITLSRLRAGERIEHYETHRVRKNGERLEVSLTISPIRNSRGVVIGASKIARDITQRKRGEEALRISEKIASAGQLAATVAHEINNPLESVVNLVYLARTGADDPSKVMEYLSTAEEELGRIAHLTKQTLGFYREQVGVAPVRAGELLRQLILVLSPKARNKRVNIDLELVNDPEILVNAGEIRQLFANLLGNSIDACNVQGLIRVRVSRQFSYRLGRPGLRITVADNGTGIKRSDRERLFQPFFTTKKDFGTGLGLWVGKEIVDRHAGRITLRSDATPGRSWTVISVFLPTLPTEENAFQKVA